MLLPKLHQDLEPFFLRHHDVRDQQVGVGVLEELQPFLAVARFDHGVAKMGQGQLQHGPDGVIVVDEENSSHA
jgi:hypothetical protein